MSTDRVANVRKYAPDADDAAIAGIIRICGLDEPDAAWVSFADPAERDRLREQFLKGRLELVAPDEQLDGAIELVGQRLQGELRPDRVTVCYLLAEHFGRLQVFRADDHAPHHLSLHSAGSAALGAAGEAAAFIAGAPISGAADATIQLGDLVAETAEATEERFAATLSRHHAPGTAATAGRPWRWLVPGVLIAALLIWLLFFRH